MITRSGKLLTAGLTFVFGLALICYFNFPRWRLCWLLGSPAPSMIANPTRVDALRLASVWRGSGTTQVSTQVAGRYPVIEAHTITDTTLVRALGSVLLDPNNYEQDPNRVSTCTFDPAISLRVFSGTESVDILICFKCDQLEVLDSAGRMLSRYYLNIHPGRPKLLPLAKRAFPREEAIQILN
jgi:hypothetical protein